jgi:hypothetical protein
MTICGAERQAELRRAGGRRLACAVARRGNWAPLPGDVGEEYLGPLWGLVWTALDCSDLGASFGARGVDWSGQSCAEVNIEVSIATQTRMGFPAGS